MLNRNGKGNCKAGNMSDVCDVRGVSNAGNQASGQDSNVKGDKLATSKISNCLFSIAQVISILVLAVLSAIAIFCTCSFSFDVGQEYLESTYFAHIFNAIGVGEIASGALCAVILLCLLFVVWKCKPGRANPKAVLVCACVWVFLAQVIWVLSLGTQFYTFPDTKGLSTATNDLLSGYISAFTVGDESQEVYSPNFYFALYPFQAGSMYLFALIFMLFGQNNFIAFQLLNALANVVVVISLFWIVKNYTDNIRTQNLCSLLCAVCVPLIMSCTLVYANTFGLMFSTLALALLTYALKQSEQKHANSSKGGACGNADSARGLRDTAKSGVCGKEILFIVLSFVSIALAIVIKNTCIIFLIAMLIMLIVESIRARSVAMCVIALVCALLAQQAGGVPTKILESQTGADFGDGMPKTSWISMGLRDDNPLEVPGWWSFYAYNVYVENNTDYQAQNSAALSDIKDSLSNFAQHPKYAAKFFGKKLASEWAHPLYQTDYYSSFSATGQNTEHDYNLLGIFMLYGHGVWPTRLFSDAYQLVIYLSAFAFCVMAFRGRKKVRCVNNNNRSSDSNSKNSGGSNDKQNGDSCDRLSSSSSSCSINISSNRCMLTLLPVVIALGFFVYVFWEAKAIYTLPFFIVMLPMASVVLDKLFSWYDKRMRA